MNAIVRITALFLCALTCESAPAASFPSNPTSIAQCEAAMRAASEKISFHSRMQDEYGRQWREVDRQGHNACRGARDYSRCAEGYRPRVRQLQEKATEHYREYIRLRNEAFPQNNACRAAARAHEQRVAQQQRQARELEHRNEDLRRQREQAQARSEAMQRQQREDLERANRQSANPQRNQPQVIGQVPPSPYDPATRNRPQTVYTPQQREAARQEELRRQEQQKREEAQALRDVARGNVVRENVDAQILQAGRGSVAVNDGRNAIQRGNDRDFERAMERGQTAADEGSEARRRLLDQALNRQGHQDPRLNQSVQSAQDTNSQMNRGGPAVTQMQNDAYAAAGSLGNNALGQLEGARESINGMQAQGTGSAPAPAAPRPAIALPRRESGNATLFQQAIAEQAGSAGGPSQMAGGSTQVATAQPASTAASPSPAPAGADCQQRYDAQEADFKVLMQRKPARGDAIQELQNIMYMTSERVQLLDAYCRSHARYGERQSMSSTYQQARQTCQSRASNPAGCVPRRGW